MPARGLFGSLAVRAAELEHEVVDHAVEVQAVVEAALRELDEVARGDRHLVDEELDRRCRRARSRASRSGWPCGADASTTPPVFSPADLDRRGRALATKETGETGAFLATGAGWSRGLRAAVNRRDTDG